MFSQVVFVRNDFNYIYAFCKCMLIIIILTAPYCNTGLCELPWSFCCTHSASPGRNPVQSGWTHSLLSSQNLCPGLEWKSMV